MQPISVVKRLLFYVFLLFLTLIGVVFESDVVVFFLSKGLKTRTKLIITAKTISKLIMRLNLELLDFFLFITLL